MASEKKEASGKQRAISEPKEDELRKVPLPEELVAELMKDAFPEDSTDTEPTSEGERQVREFGSVTVAFEDPMPGAQVMAATSEEFRESLQTLQGSLELLLAGKVSDLRSAKKFLGIAYRETEYLNNRVGDLQIASAIESGKLRMKLTGLDLNALLNVVVEKLSPAAQESQVEIESTELEELPTIRGDESLMRMLLTNLLERVIKATPAKGTVLITIEPVGEYVDVQMTNREAKAPQYVEIQLNEASERGLALYVAEQIAYAHDGGLIFMGIDHEVKAITLTLPVQLKGHRRGKILVVDDNPQAATLLEYALEEEGFEAIKALNGVEGLKLAKTERVDLVILDILLPGIDGFEVCHRLRAAPETASTPVIVISAKAQEEDRATALRIGADAYFGKPLGMSELMKAIENLLEENDSPGWKPS